MGSDALASLLRDIASFTERTPKLTTAEHTDKPTDDLAVRGARKLLDESFINVANWLEEEIVKTFSETEGVSFISGNGVNMPLVS